MQAITIPIYGRLADLFGRKSVFFIGTGLFSLAPYCAAMPGLILFRALQGLGQSLFRALQGLGVGAIVPLATASIVFTRMVESALGTAILGATLNMNLQRRLPTRH